MNCLDYLNKLADHNASVSNPVSAATIGVREKTLRRKLRLKKSQPLEYRGMTIRCVGSKKWRTDTDGSLPA